MNMRLLNNLNVYQRVQLTATLLAGLLILLLMIGAVWVATLPPAPVVLPSPEAMQATGIVLSADEAEAHYLDGFVIDPTAAEVDVSQDVDGSAESGSVMASRPLFWSGRRPVPLAEDEPAEIAVDAVQPSDLDRVELAGVYYAGKASGVIVRVNGERMRVPLGETLMGWKLESVDATEIKFINGSQQKVIQLEHARLSDYTPAASSRAQPAAGKAAPRRTQEP